MRGPEISKRVFATRQSVTWVAVLTCSLLSAACWETHTHSPTSDETIEIGALVSLSGPNAGAGPVHLAAMDIALEDVMRELDTEGLTFNLNTGDTQSEPYAASVLMNTFLLQNTRVVIGPYTSAEVAAAAPRIRNSHSLLISPSSTSLNLANRNDHIFRLSPNDSHMAESLVDLMHGRGHQYLALVYRDDTWGHSVAEEMERQFTAAGGTVISSYSYSSSDPAVVESILESVLDDITTQAGDRPPAEVALQLTSMGEGSIFLSTAQQSVPELGDFQWYGSDGYVRDWRVFETVERAEFATQVDFTSPMYRVEVPDHYWNVIERIEYITGVTPGASTLLTYDATKFAAHALARVGPYASYEALERSLRNVLANSQGVSGWVDLDAMGDRLGGTYDFYAVRDNGWEYDWVRLRSAQRHASTGTE